MFHVKRRRRKVRFVRNAQAWAFLTRSLAPPYPLCPFGTSSRPLLAFGQYPTPSGLRPSPPDRGSRPLDKGSRPFQTGPASAGLRFGIACGRDVVLADCISFASP